MELCPNCNRKVNTDGKSGLFGTKNAYLSNDIINEINDYLPEGLRGEKLCTECINPSDYTEGRLLTRIIDWEKENDRLQSELKKRQNELESNIALKAINVVRFFSIIPKDFEPIEMVEGIVMFDSGARSTSADNLNAGIWNVINDTIALQLGNTQNVTDAITAAKMEIAYKAIKSGCDIVADLRPTYSDLAANGKILLHLSGTYGTIGKYTEQEEIQKLNSELASLKDEISILSNQHTKVSKLKPLITYRKYLQSTL